MSFVRLFSKASPLLPQRHTFSQTWTWIIANSAAANKHRCMPHLQTLQRTHGQRRTTNPTKLGFHKGSQTRINLIRTTAALSHSHFITTLGTSPGGILLVNPAAALLLDGRCSTKQQRREHENSRLVNLAAGGLCTWRHIKAQLVVSAANVPQWTFHGYKFMKAKKKKNGSSHYNVNSTVIGQDDETLGHLDLSADKWSLWSYGGSGLPFF